MNSLREIIVGFVQSNRGYVWLIIALGANFLVYSTMTRGLSNKQERLAADRTSLELELARSKQALSRVSVEYGVILSNRETVSRFFDEVVQTRVPGLTEAWNEIDRLASESGVLRGRTNYDRELLEIGLEQVQARMPVEGSYFDLVEFLNALERSPRFFLVEEVRITQARDDEQYIQLNCSISFFLRPALAQTLAAQMSGS